jgi:hypothetical protein
MLIGPCKVLVHCGYWLEGEKAELKVPDPDPGFRDHVFVEELKTASPVLLQGKYPIVTGIDVLPIPGFHNKYIWKEVESTTSVSSYSAPCKSIDGPSSAVFPVPYG